LEDESTFETVKLKGADGPGPGERIRSTVSERPSAKKRGRWGQGRGCDSANETVPWGSRFYTNGVFIGQHLPNPTAIGKMAKEEGKRGLKPPPYHQEQTTLGEYQKKEKRPTQGSPQGRMAFRISQKPEKYSWYGKSLTSN